MGFGKFQRLDPRRAAKSLSFQIPGIVGQCGNGIRCGKKGKNDDDICIYIFLTTPLFGIWTDFMNKIRKYFPKYFPNRCSGFIPAQLATRTPAIFILTRLFFPSLCRLFVATKSD